ncbi:VOC family protein, partial [Sinorhizobium meliloti]|nr:VOC family protein [Sinorhizobium meliloti]
MAEITFDPRKVFHYGFVVPNMDRALKTWTQQGARLVVPPAIDPTQNVSCALLIYLDSVPIELVAPLRDG